MEETKQSVEDVLSLDMSIHNRLISLPENIEDELSKLSPSELQILAKRAELEKSAAELGIPPELLQRMRDYTAQLRKQFPHMKENRMRRKVAEYFKSKINLI